MKRAQALAKEIPGAWYPCQHLNPLNPEAHALYTAREIEAAFDGPPDVIVVGISTAGQIGGLVKYFRSRRAPVRFVGVDVAGSAIFGTPRHPYKLSGLGLSFSPPNFDVRSLDAAYSIPDQLAFSMCHALARQEGLLLGGSTGAIVAAGLAYASQLEGGQKVVMLNPDRGDRYLETFYSPDWLEANHIRLLADTELSQAIATLSPVSPSLLLAAEPAAVG
jgi:cysteine synthase A